jgi:hypothetical protein
VSIASETLKLRLEHCQGSVVLQSQAGGVDVAFLPRVSSPSLGVCPTRRIDFISRGQKDVCEAGRDLAEAGGRSRRARHSLVLKGCVEKDRLILFSLTEALMSQPQVGTRTSVQRSSCFPAGKLKSSDLNSGYQGAPAGTYSPSRAILPLMDCALTALSPRVGNCSL